MKQIQSDLNEALELSEAIQDAIVEKDLEKVAELDAIRQQVIDRYFSSALQIDEALTIRLKKMNDAIVQRLTELQSEIRSAKAQVSKAAKGVQAYKRNAFK